MADINPARIVEREITHEGGVDICQNTVLLQSLAHLFGDPSSSSVTSDDMRVRPNHTHTRMYGCVCISSVMNESNMCRSISVMHGF